MLNQRLAAAKAVQASLYEAELGGAAALKSATNLIATSLNAREHANLGPIFGQEAIDHMAAAVSSIAQGMRYLRDAHIALKTHREEAGLSGMFGDESWTPTWLMADAGVNTRRLQSVS